MVPNRYTHSQQTKCKIPKVVLKTWPAKAQEVSSPTITKTANNKHSNFRNICFCEEMRGRAVVLILFCWAALTIITPILVRMSASAKATINFNDERSERIMAKIDTLLPRRALVATVPPQAPARHRL